MDGYEGMGMSMNIIAWFVCFSTSSSSSNYVRVSCASACACILQWKLNRYSCAWFISFFVSLKLYQKSNSIHIMHSQMRHKWSFICAECPHEIWKILHKRVRWRTFVTYLFFHSLSHEIVDSAHATRTCTTWEQVSKVKWALSSPNFISLFLLFFFLSFSFCMKLIIKPVD